MTCIFSFIDMMRSLVVADSQYEMENKIFLETEIIIEPAEVLNYIDIKTVSLGSMTHGF